MEVGCPWINAPETNRQQRISWRTLLHRDRHEGARVMPARPDLLYQIHISEKEVSSLTVGTKTL
jgi:hypothetical protein